MEQEQNQVLAMLESGKITPEQADELLAALQPEESVTETVDLPSQNPEKQKSKEVNVKVKADKKTASRKRGGFTAREIVEMGIHGIDPKFVQDMRKLFGDLSFKQVIELGIHNIKPEFVQEVRALGLGQLDFKAVVQMGIHGVDTQFVKELRDQGLDDLSTEEIIEFAIHGINADFVRKVQSLESEFSDIAERSNDSEDSNEASLG